MSVDGLDVRFRDPGASCRGGQVVCLATQMSGGAEAIGVDKSYFAK